MKTMTAKRGDEMITAKVWRDPRFPFYVVKTLEELNALSRRGYSWKRIW